MGMSTLITNVKTFLETAISAGEITATSVHRGLHSDPRQIQRSRFPYIALDDGGERSEETGAQDAQWRVYSLIVEFAVFTTNRETAMTSLLDLNDQIKTTIEAETNRLYDDLNWGISITPFSWDDEQYFFRGRTVLIEYKEYSETYDLRH